MILPLQQDDGIIKIGNLSASQTQSHLEIIAFPDVKKRSGVFWDYVMNMYVCSMLLRCLSSVEDRVWC